MSRREGHWSRGSYPKSAKLDLVCTSMMRGTGCSKCLWKPGVDAHACNAIIQEPEARGSAAGDQPRPHSSRATWDAQQATISQKQNNSSALRSSNIPRKNKSAVHGSGESKLKHEHACCESKWKNDASSWYRLVTNGKPKPWSTDAGRQE